MAFAKLYSAIGKQGVICLSPESEAVVQKFDGLKNNPPNHKVIHLWKKGDIPRFEVWTNHGG